MQPEKNNDGNNLHIMKGEAMISTSIHSLHADLAAELGNSWYNKITLEETER